VLTCSAWARNGLAVRKALWARKLFSSTYAVRELLRVLELLLLLGQVLHAATLVSRTKVTSDSCSFCQRC
jgi:hypothetical protein